MSNFAPGVQTTMFFIAEQNSVRIDVVLYYSFGCYTLVVNKYVAQHRAHCVKTCRHTQNRKHITWRRCHTEDQATARGNVPKNSMRFGHVVFEVCKLTDRQTLYSSQHCTLLGTKCSSSQISTMRTPAFRLYASLP